MGTPSKLGFPSDHSFFGFNPEDRIKLHDNLFNLVWHGEGRWDWDTVYNMPIIIRRHWSKRVNQLVAERNEYEEQKLQLQLRMAGAKKPGR